jgi:Coenzyme PQQ synthesis protein D (PqqD)
VTGDGPRYVATTRQVSTTAEGEAVILQMDSGTYYGLDRVGTRIWDLLAEPRTLAELRDAVVAQFEVEPDRAEGDLRRLLDDLRGQGLVEEVAPD